MPEKSTRKGGDLSIWDLGLGNGEAVDLGFGIGEKGLKAQS
jgi:hypothetical protein